MSLSGAERLLLEYPTTVSKWTAHEGTVGPRTSGGFLRIRNDDTTRYVETTEPERYVLDWWPRWEGRKRLLRALDTVELDWLESQVVYLLYWRQLPVYRVAQRLQVSPKRIFNARASLLRKLAKALEEQVADGAGP